MVKDHAGDALRQLRRLFESGSAAGLSDGELLRRFAARRDEAAFEALVARHGPMVLGVCRAFLRDAHAVEDAFQAVFLVLVRKAASIRVDDSLGRWLHGVTRRVAARAGRRREGAAPDPRNLADELGDDPLEWGELRVALHEEVGRLPEKYRRPVLACYFEGQSHEQAAELLRWPLGTVKGRLARARGLLRDRLTRRGLALPAGLIGAVLAREASAAVPAALRDATVRAALGFAAGPGLGAGAFPTAVALADGVLRTMHMTKLKTSGLALLTLGVLTAGAGVASSQGPGSGRPAEPKAPATAAPDIRLDDPAPAALPVDLKHAQRMQDLERVRDDLFATESTVILLREQLRQAEASLNIAHASHIHFGGDEAGVQAIHQFFTNIGGVEVTVYWAPGRAEQPLIPKNARDPVQAGDMVHFHFPEPPTDLRGRKLSLHDLTVPVQRNETLRLGEFGLLNVAGLTGREVKPALLAQLARHFETGRPSKSSRRAPESAQPAESGTSAYVVKPPDVLSIEAEQALPDRPIQGEFLVRPDGTVSLGHYGEVYVSGLTLDALKAKLVIHLRTFLSDEALGLSAGPGHAKVPPAKARRVRVSVLAYNSKFCYVQGEVKTPGRFPVTGNEAVLDAINYAGGLTSKEPMLNVRLDRAAPSGGLIRTLPVDYAAISQGDASTNYPLLAGDRVYVYRDPEASEQRPASPAPSASKPGQSAKAGTRVVVYSIADLIRTPGAGSVRSPEADAAPLIDLIKATVAPGSWTDGGPLNAPTADDQRTITLSVVDLFLIIRQTPEAHDQIAALLQGLRRLGPLQEPASEEIAAEAISSSRPASAKAPDASTGRARRRENMEERLQKLIDELGTLKRELEEGDGARPSNPGPATRPH